MNKENKKKKIIFLLSRLPERREAEKRLADHRFQYDNIPGKALFTVFPFRELLERSEGLSLTFSKPHCYRVEQEEKTRLGRELRKNAEISILQRPVRSGYMLLIS